MVRNNYIPGKRLTSDEAQALLTNKLARTTEAMFVKPQYAFSKKDFEEIRDAAKHSCTSTSRFRLRCFVFNGVIEVFISPRLGKTSHEHVPCGRFPLAKVLTSARL